MNEYEFIPGLDGQTFLTNAIRRISDGALIPFDILNTDYQQYLIDTNGTTSEEELTNGRNDTSS